MDKLQHKESESVDPEKLEELYNPYEVNRDAEEIKNDCELCQAMPCCPEHCCNWDDCECGDCDECQPKTKKDEQKANKQRPASAYRKNFNPREWKNEFEPCDEPEILIKATGEEKIEQKKIKKKILMSKKEQEAQDAEEAEKTYIEAVPNEVITTNDDVQICNFEVDFQEEEEIRFASGVKGIKALRMQRELIQKEIGEVKEIKDLAAVSGNKFADIETE